MVEAARKKIFFFRHRGESVREGELRALKEADFQDYLVFEFRAQPPADAAKAGLDYIRSLL